MTKSLVNEIETKTKKLIELLGSNAEVEVVEKEDTFSVNLKADDETGLLIGRHGETINSIQSILALSLREDLKEKKIFINVGDWREKQEEKLSEMAEQIYQRVIDTGEAQPVYNLTPAQRRIIHITLSEKKDVETESTGEGENRYILVKPKKNK